MKGRAAPSRSRKKRSFQWEHLSDKRLLEVRLCDLGVTIKGTALEERIEKVSAELTARGIRFRPHFWLSDDWFTPDGIPGVAIPFYLAHPRLAQLEERKMLEVEGGTPDWCLSILRHEAGHAIDNAFRLRRRRRRIRLFGKSSEPYPEHYAPRPYSRSFVIHLDAWYAQSHPDEDFAETFAVWLNPDSMWRKRYAGWRALAKLEYMDQLMSEIAPTKPLVTTRRQVEPLSRLSKTLGMHYAEKRERYQVDYPRFYDRDLRRLFSNSAEVQANMTAAAFLTKNRQDVRRVVARWTGAYQYTIDQVLEDMIQRSRELKLHLDKPEQITVFEFTVLLTVQTMNYLQSGRHRLSL
ncbi:MAG: putative zinc-binding metallopeptidase [Vicinamibacteria bacterium]